MELWHFTWSSRDRFPLFPDEARQRAWVRHVVHKAGERIALLGAGDDHAHVTAIATEDERPQLSRRLTMTLQPLAAPELAPVFVKRVENRAHLIRLVGYLHGQPRHHGLDVHPAVWSGSTFPDLVGARVLPGFTPRLWEALPRFTAEDVGRGIGLQPGDWIPASDARVEEAGVATLVLAAAAATCADPALLGRSAGVVRARSVAVHLGRAAGFGTLELADALTLDPRSIRKLRARPVDPEIRAAARRMVTLLQRFADPSIVQAGLRGTEARGTTDPFAREAPTRCSSVPR